MPIPYNPLLALCAGNSPVPGEFPAQRASNAENVFSIWWRHRVMHAPLLVYVRFLCATFCASFYTPQVPTLCVYTRPVFCHTFVWRCPSTLRRLNISSHSTDGKPKRIFCQLSLAYDESLSLGVGLHDVIIMTRSRETIQHLQGYWEIIYIIYISRYIIHFTPSYHPYAMLE